MQYRVPAEKKPSIWNEDTAVGALLGTLIFPIIGTAIGGAIGGSIGKARMEEDERSGRVVKEPTFWNKKAAIWTLAGIFFTPIAAGIVVAAATFVFTGAALTMGLGISMVAATIGGIVGLARGGRAGIKEMENDWQAARHYNDTRSKEPGCACTLPVEPAPSLEQTTSKELPPSPSREQAPIKELPKDGFAAAYDARQNTPPAIATAASR